MLAEVEQQASINSALAAGKAPEPETDQSADEADNEPAVSLYLGEGFERVRAVEVAPKVEIAEFKRVT